MPHTMLKADTHSTKRFLRRGGMMRQYDPAIHRLPIAEKHRPGETGRQLAERLRAEAAMREAEAHEASPLVSVDLAQVEGAIMADPAKAKPKAPRKPRKAPAKAATE